jgi:hypothetical protein
MSHPTKRHGQKTILGAAELCRRLRTFRADDLEKNDTFGMPAGQALPGTAAHGTWLQWPTAKLANPSGHQDDQWLDAG